jgi:hypothetical protein
MQTGWGIAAAAATLAGCLGAAPDLLSGDAGPDATNVDAQPGADATTESGMVGVSTDDGSTNDALGDGGVGDAQGAACVDGGPCFPGPCELGTMTCSASAESCASSQKVTNGTSCDAGGAGYAVCNQGACHFCNAGGDCTEAGSCQQMNVVCTSGSPVCTAMGNVTDGKPCGANLFCNAGSCAPCTPDAGCEPTTNRCNVGTVSCVGGQVVCNDQMTPAADGKSCGTNMVCKGGSCGSCTANVQCTPTGQPCQTGLTSCATGTSVCMATGNVQVNTPCGASGTNMSCDGAGNCKCAGGFTSCNNSCVNESSDNGNCGVCSHNCVHPNSCSSGSCQQWILAHTGGTTGFTHVLASDGTNLVWLDGSGVVEQVPLAGGTPITLGPIKSGYTASSIAVAAGVVAWTGWISPSSTNPFGGAGAVFTAVEGTANSGGTFAVATDNDSAAVGADGIGLKSNGTTAYYLNTGGQSNVEGCTLVGLSGTCSNIGAYGAGEFPDDLIVNGSTIFWTSYAGGTVSSQAIGSSAVNSIATGEGGPILLAADGTYVYWANTTTVGGNTSFAVDRNPQVSPNPAGSTNVLPSTSGTVMSLATDGKYLYYAGTMGGAGIGYVPVGGGSGTPLVTTTGGGVPTVIAVGGAIYWANTDDKTIRGMAAPP